MRQRDASSEDKQPPHSRRVLQPLLARIRARPAARSARYAGSGSRPGHRRRSSPERPRSRARSAPRSARRCRSAHRGRRCGRGSRRRSSGRSRTAIPSIAHALRLQLCEHLHFGDAGHAPAGEEIDQTRLAGREIGRGQCRLAGSAAGRANAGTGLPSSVELTVVSAGVASRHTSAATTSRQQRQAGRSGRRGSCVALPPPFGSRAAGACATAARATPARRRARSAPRRPRSESRTASTTAAAASRPTHRACRSRCTAGRSRRCRSPLRWSRSAGR